MGATSRCRKPGASRCPHRATCCSQPPSAANWRRSATGTARSRCPCCGRWRRAGAVSVTPNSSRRSAPPCATRSPTRIRSSRPSAVSMVGRGSSASVVQRGLRASNSHSVTTPGGSRPARSTASRTRPTRRRWSRSSTATSRWGRRASPGSVPRRAWSSRGCASTRNDAIRPACAVCLPERWRWPASCRRRCRHRSNRRSKTARAAWCWRRPAPLRPSGCT